VACEELASLVSAYALAAARARIAARYMLSMRGGVTRAEYEDLRSATNLAEGTVADVRKAIADHCAAHGCAAAEPPESRRFKPF
jgi:hypothetical protein